MGMEKFCHKVLSNEDIPKKHDAVIRSLLKDNINNSLNGFSEILESKTIFIRNEDDLKNFYLDNKEIKINPNGYINWENKFGWKYGELGIWASNFLAWKSFEKSNYDYLIIFEDDVKILENFTTLLPKYIESLPADWEILGLYSTPFEWSKYREEYDIEGNEDICQSFHELNLAAYVINKKAVFKILEKIKTPIKEPIDLYIFSHPRKFNSFDIKLNAEQIVKRQYIVPSTFQNVDQVMPMTCLEE